MKILIIGSVASGKTTLAKKISSKNKIDYYEIDSIVYDDLNKRKRKLEEQIDIINNINKSDNWIIEGTLRKNLYFLLDLADKIIYLNIPLNKRKRRIFTRFIKQKIGIEKCNYKPDINILKMMYKWTNDFEREKNIFEKKLSKYNEKLVILSDVNKECFDSVYNKPI